MILNNYAVLRKIMSFISDVRLSFDELSNLKTIQFNNNSFIQNSVEW